MIEISGEDEKKYKSETIIIVIKVRLKSLIHLVNMLW